MPTTGPDITTLYQQHQHTVHRYLARRVGPDLAEDLAQEVWVRALRNLDRWEDRGRPIEAWLTTIARNLIADHHKASMTRLETAVADPSTLPHATAGDPAEQILQEADTAPVRQAVSHLSPPQRRAVVLRHWAGLRNAEIADELGCTPLAVRALQHRATTALRSTLAA